MVVDSDVVESDAEGRSPRTGRLYREDSTRLNEADHWTLLRSQFQEMKTVPLTNVIALKSVHGLSRKRDIVRVDGSRVDPHATSRVTHTGPEFELSIPSAADDTEVLFGPFDDSDGWGWGLDAEGAFVFRRNAGTTVKTRPSDFQAGRSFTDEELRDEFVFGRIWQCDFPWYGHGPAAMKTFLSGVYGRSDPRIVHIIAPEDGAVSVRNPNLPLRAEITNSSNTTVFQSAERGRYVPGYGAESGMGVRLGSRDATQLTSVFVSGRKFATVGPIFRNPRRTMERVENVAIDDTGFTPIITMRRKAEGQGGGNQMWHTVGARVFDSFLFTDTDAWWRLRIAEDVNSGATWATPTDYDAEETGLEVSTDATGLTGYDTVIDVGYAEASQGNSPGFTEGEPLQQQFIEDLVFCLEAKAISGTGSVLRSFLKVEEES